MLLTLETCTFVPFLDTFPTYFFLVPLLWYPCYDDDDDVVVVVVIIPDAT